MAAQGLNRPIIDVVTRWNSTFQMLKSLLKFREFCAEHIEDKFNLNIAEWRDVDELVATLDPIYEATLKLQSSQLFLGDFYILWMQLKLKVQANNSDNNQLLFKCLEKREERLLNSPSVLACVYLDPRIRRLLIKNPIKMMCAKSHLRQLIRQILMLKKGFPSQENNGKGECDTSEDICLSPSIETSDVIWPETQSQSSTSLLGNLLNSIEVSPSDEESDDHAEDSDLQKAINEVECYAPKQLDLDVPIMEYWKKKQYTHPYLWSLAKVVHSTPATQVSVERSFSALKLVLSDLRCNLSPGILEKILFLKTNKM
ncbi:PREDICTED: uncharacterized protein LOC108362420 [Rhagoletis zephyria]|uniref:uncharacterized protein LOC108362420 n=1 Tax=Rhagoletis zephyria TaxID=28612 RepID=UPI000811AAD5|nr:PREDICTED: uncharacterized protein LOC108362420 [Rhagoletis zephyria]